MSIALSHAIWSALLPVHRARVSAIEVYDVLPSTQKLLTQRSVCLGRDWLLVVARQQTDGIGRQGRAWVANSGQVTFSWRGWVRINPSSVGLLSLTAALAVQNALSALGVQGVQLKWPNDIYIAQRKLAGVLISVCEQKHDRFDIVLGIGLNRLVGQLPVEAIALADVMPNVPDMAQLITGIVHEWLRLSQQLVSESDSVALVTRWKSQALWLGESVYVMQASRIIEGVFRDILPSGALLMNTQAGEQVFMAGDVQLRDRIN
ncbi:MAG: biotin--[acetyl-CoA-carboxylase] ligase [Thiotrichales bacterium]|jgi:BirA family biotin operon repressor/biotin-[acetyl-CoA-carboxylase] ligase|nr:biotin--[acetyl-CoA-carboxylase] ligase [Thiotrichales bacterium]